MSGSDPKLLPFLHGFAPVSLATGLCHLPGFVFLDASSTEEEFHGRPGAARFSLITARPRSVVRGNLFVEEDFVRLHQILAENRSPEESTPDLGFPGAGLYGTICFEGDFLFGEYHEFLVYDHRLETWRENGTLSAHWLAQRDESAPAKIPSLAFRSGMDRAAFCDRVECARDYIAAGDIYQVNLSHRFTAAAPVGLDPFALYRRLREVSPAPFSAYLSLEGRTVLSTSPEQFLRMSGRTIQTRPIKGTRPRFRDRERDERSAYDLITSPKEIAELVMITDLERNDLGQVCEYGSVTVTEMLKLERYAQVFHLVSTVEGTLRDDTDHLSALRACFPGGSITGAPKRRAREIIAELESLPRGLYTGAIGCFGFNGESRFNIAIRTLVAEANELHFHVGAGIVADSIPAKEWEETLHKASGILQACEGGAPILD